ncbi:MAG: hypothetical protein GTN89_08395, partial [Acidobacteria bacterium]|nr:hypothetical protein [Acidobacteriota bacterium]
DLDGLGFNGGDVLVGYGDLTAENALAGVSGGLFATNGIEPEDDLTSFGDKVVKLQVKNEAAAYEIFEFGELNDLANTSQRYRVGKEFKDRFESNDSAT